MNKTGNHVQLIAKIFVPITCKEILLIGKKSQITQWKKMELKGKVTEDYVNTFNKCGKRFSPSPICKMCK